MLGWGGGKGGKGIIKTLNVVFVIIRCFRRCQLMYGVVKVERG
jgi:hypothetical protein